MSKFNKTECPKCKQHNVNFLCNNCELPISTLHIAKQYMKNFVIPYQLQKLSIEKDDILIITPETPLTQNEAQNLIEMFQSSTKLPFYIIFMNENIKIENLNDEKLKSIGLKRIEENKK